MRRAGSLRAAEWIFGWLLSDADRDALIGDLAEEHTLRLRSQSGAAWWYWNQVTRSLAALLWAAVRRGRWLGALGAAIAAYGLVYVVEWAGGTALSGLLGRVPLVDWLITLAITLSAMVLGGYLAARMRRGAVAVLALISAASVIRLMLTTGHIVPLRYQLPWLVLCPIAALAGGALWRRHDAGNTPLSSR